MAYYNPWKLHCLIFIRDSECSRETLSILKVTCRLASWYTQWFFYMRHMCICKQYKKTFCRFAQAVNYLSNDFVQAWITLIQDKSLRASLCEGFMILQSCSLAWMIKSWHQSVLKAKLHILWQLPYPKGMHDVDSNKRPWWSWNQEATTKQFNYIYAYIYVHVNNCNVLYNIFYVTSNLK